jgi:exopolyphosphatase/guanosine-5'-triphosphate,3'-diphosphate pyrophosphatase
MSAVGTAALRDADNREEFLRRAHERCGLDIAVIPGEEEARLSFLAVRRDPRWRDVQRLLVIDIGGGSTEIIQGEGNSDRIAGRVSINLGAVRLTESLLKSDPPTVTQLTAAHRAAGDAFQQVVIDRDGAPFAAVGVGGTLTNLAGMDLGSAGDPNALHGHRLTVDHLEQQIERLARATVIQRKEIPGLDPGRADIILGGAILLSQALAWIGAGEVAVSARGLRWGLLYDRFL